LSSYFVEEMKRKKTTGSESTRRANKSSVDTVGDHPTAASQPQMASKSDTPPTDNTSMEMGVQTDKEQPTQQTTTSPSTQEMSTSATVEKLEGVVDVEDTTTPGVSIEKDDT